MNPEQIRTLLDANGRRANRALGQNFCIDSALLLDCVRNSDFPVDLPILEIGPGLGALTEELLKTGASVIAVEKDAFLAEQLPALMQNEKLHVVCGDILRVPLEQLLPSSFSVAGNLPYYITTPILERILPLLPERMLVMVQKEASARFFANPGDRVYGPVSILTRVFYSAQYLADVSPDRYYPQPDVSSSVILLKKNAASADAPKFVSFLHRAFSMRRKKLTNNFPGSVLPDLLSEEGFSPSVRAEELSPDDLLRLFLRFPE